MEIKRILVATDLSTEARRSYNHAIAIARGFGATIVLVHVSELAEYGLTSSRELRDYLASVEHQIAQRLRSDAAFIENQGVQVEIREKTGDPAHGLLTLLETGDYQLVSLGRRPQGSDRHVVMGSTAIRLLREAATPVLITPFDCQQVPELTGQSIRRLLVASDFSVDSERAMRYCLRFAPRLEAEITLVHVLRIPAPVALMPGEAPVHVPLVTTENTRAKREQQLRDMTLEHDADHVDVHVAINHDVARGVLETGDLWCADLVVIPSHGKGALGRLVMGSTSERVMKMAKRPLLVLPKRFLDAQFRVAFSEIVVASVTAHPAH